MMNLETSLARPTLTIRAMVRIGPWTVQDRERHEGWYSCERCQTLSKDIWVCEVDESEGVQLAELEGRRVWRIGSTCGPILVKVSEEVWKGATRGVESRLELLKRFTKLAGAAHGASVVLPALILERGPLIASNTLDSRALKHLGFVMTGWERRLGLRE